MANIQKTFGIILSTIPFKESSLICSIFTKNYGKIKIIAKGARRPKSKLCGTLEPFSLDEIIFYKREFKEIYTLSDAVIIDNFEKIRAYMKKVNAAEILCEFLDKTLPAEEPDERTYSLLLNFLKRLQEVEESSIKASTLYHLFGALTLTGVKPHLDDCIRCHQKIESASDKINFSLNEGGIVCDKHFDDTVVLLSSEAIDALRKTYEDKVVNTKEDILNELENFITAYLYYHLNGLVLNSLKHLT